MECSTLYEWAAVCTHMRRHFIALGSLPCYSFVRGDFGRAANDAWFGPEAA